MQGLYLWHCSVRGRNPTLLPIQGRRVWFRSLSQVYMYVQHEPLDLFYFSKAAQGGPGLSSDARNERIPYFPSTTPRLNESTTRHEIEKPRRAAAKSCHPVSKSFLFPSAFLSFFLPRNNWRSLLLLCGGGFYGGFVVGTSSQVSSCLQQCGGKKENREDRYGVY